VRTKLNPAWAAYRQATTSMLVPVYQYPTLGTFYSTCNQLAPVVKYVVANPASGPGSSVDPGYAAAISAAQAAGITVLGYVDTDFALGGVTLATAEANVTEWNVLYPGVTSIFIDRASSLTGVETSYYQPLCAQIHGVTGAVAVLNFGSVPDQGYMAFTDIAVIFENDYMNGSWASFLASVPSWVGTYAASRFSALVYDVPLPLYMQMVLAQSQAANIGNVYVTDQSAYAFNPWGAQAAYMAAEAATLAAR